MSEEKSGAASKKAAPKKTSAAKKSPAAAKSDAPKKKKPDAKPAPDKKQAAAEEVAAIDVVAEEIIIDVEASMADEPRSAAAPAGAAEAAETGESREIPRRDVFRAWWKAARPPFYVATLVPLFLGYYAAKNDVAEPSLLVFTGVLLVGFLLHLAANLANDLYDYLLGTDTQESIGGSRGLQDGTITVNQLRLALLACYWLTAFFTVLGVWLTGLWGLFVIALFGALASYYYVAPPIMYGYRAMGELFVFISMGLVMTCGSYYALAGEMESYVMALSIPVGLMVAGILYYQSLPEIESDAAMGKKTLVGVLGPEKAVFLFKLWWPIVWLLIITLYLADLLAWPALLGVILSIPLHKKACLKVNAVTGAAPVDWFSLDRYGKYVRIMYFVAGLFMLAGVAAL